MYDITHNPGSVLVQFSRIKTLVLHVTTMARRPHSRAFSRSVTAPRCMAVDTARAPVAVSSIVACEPSKGVHERPRSFRKGLVDVFVPSDARVSKKKQKQRQRRRKHQAGSSLGRYEPHIQADVRALCAYGTFVDDKRATSAIACDKKHVDPCENTDSFDTEPPTTCLVSPSSSCVPTLLTELSLDDEHEDDDYDILCVDEARMSVAPQRNHWFTSAINLFK